MEILMGRWRDAHEREIREFDLRNDLGAVRDVGTYEWIRPDDRPKEPHDLLVLVPPGPLAPAAAVALEVANAAVLSGLRAGAVALDGAEPEAEMELFFRPYRRTSAALRAAPPPSRTWVAGTPDLAGLAAALPVHGSVDPAAFFPRRSKEEQEAASPPGGFSSKVRGAAGRISRDPLGALKRRLKPLLPF